jgi:glycine/D-amino acid oxidase-like deaminating enzyme
MHDDIPALEFISAYDLTQRVPILAENNYHGALDDSNGGDLDVDAILQAYLILFRQCAGELEKGQAVLGIQRVDGAWQIRTGSSEYEAPSLSMQRGLGGQPGRISRTNGPGYYPKATYDHSGRPARELRYH